MSAKEEIEVLINRSREAQKQIENYTQEQVDELIRAMVWSVAKPGMAEEIAQFTVDETQLGNYDGKFLKIQRKTRATLMDIIDDKSVGILEEDSERAIVKIAKPDQIRNCNEELFSFDRVSSNWPSIVLFFELLILFISANVVPILVNWSSNLSSKLPISKSSSSLAFFIS